MAKNDIKSWKSRSQLDPTEFQTEAGSTAFYAGEPVKLKAAGSPYAIVCVDGDLTIGTDPVFLGFAATDSTHTASADGVVKVYVPREGDIWRAKAKTSTTVDTQAEINALVGDRVVLDLTSTTWTVDAGAGDNAANAFYILGGNPTTAEVYFAVRSDATYLSA